MRPHDVAYAFPRSMSPQFFALRRQLRNGGQGSPADAIGIVSALQELGLISEGMLEGRRGPSRPSRTSLVDDLHRSLDSLGKRARQVAGAPFEDVLRHLGDLHPRLKDAQGARTAHLTVNVLLDRLSRAEVRVAAWQDVWQQFSDPSSSAVACELSLLNFKELAELVGYEWQALRRRIDDVLSDQAIHIAAVGAAPAPESMDDVAGLAEQDRINLVANLVGESAPTGSVSIWLVFADSVVHRGWLAKGPVQFFAGWTWSDDMRPGGALERDNPLYEPPPELEDDLEFPSMILENLPLKDLVLARVFFADSTLADLPGRARDIVSGMIDLAHARSPWKIYDGHLGYRHGGGWFSLSLTAPGVLDEIDRHVPPAHERTSSRLRDLDDTFVERLVAGDRGAVQAMDEARWPINLSRIESPVQRIGLATEHVP